MIFILTHILTLFCKNKRLQIFLESNPSYKLILKNGSLRLSGMDEKFYFKLKYDKLACPIIKHVKTPSDLHSYLKHVLNGDKWRMSGKPTHFQIKNGMYCLTSVGDTKSACQVDYPMVVSPCCKRDQNQWFTSNSKEKGVVEVRKEPSFKVGFPFIDDALSTECADEGNLIKGGENDEYSIRKRIKKKVDNLPSNDCFECYNEINDKKNKDVIGNIFDCECNESSDVFGEGNCEKKSVKNDLLKRLKIKRSKPKFDSNDYEKDIYGISDSSGFAINESELEKLNESDLFDISETSSEDNQDCGDCTKKDDKPIDVNLNNDKGINDANNKNQQATQDSTIKSNSNDPNIKTINDNNSDQNTVKNNDQKDKTDSVKNAVPDQNKTDILNQ